MKTTTVRQRYEALRAELQAHRADCRLCTPSETDIFCKVGDELHDVMDHVALDLEDAEASS